MERAMRRPVHVASFTRSLRRLVTSLSVCSRRPPKRRRGRLFKQSLAADPSCANDSGAIAIINAIPAPGGCCAPIAAEAARAAAK